MPADSTTDELWIVDCDAHFTEPPDLGRRASPPPGATACPSSGRWMAAPAGTSTASHGPASAATPSGPGARRCSASTSCSRLTTSTRPRWSVPERLELHGRARYRRPGRLSQRHRLLVQPHLRHQGRAAAVGGHAPVQRLLRRHPGLLRRSPHPPGHAPRLGHGAHRAGDDPPDRQGHPGFHTLRQARAPRPARAPRAVLRADVGHLRLLRRHRQLSHRCRQPAGGHRSDPGRPLPHGAPGGHRQGSGQSLLAVVRNAAPAGRRGHPDPA